MPASPTTRARGSVSPARTCALRVVRRVFEQGAYADRALASEAAGLDSRDRALAMALSFGTVQRRATLDHIAAQLVKRPLGRLDAPVLAIVRLGLFELSYLGGAADYAVVNEMVELAKQQYPHGAGLVNAVLRRGAREGRGMLERLDDDTAEAAAVLHSVPGWLAGKWWAELGAEEARALLRVVNEPAESALRVNALVATVEEVQNALAVPSHAASNALDLPEALVLDGPFDVQGSELWRSGAVQPQSRASMLVSRMLAPEPGQRVLDLCAAPGGKTTHLAALMGDLGEIVAIERHPGRAAALERTAARLGAASVRVEVGDAGAARGDGPFQSNSGRPSLQWAWHAPVPARSTVARAARGDPGAGRRANPDPRRRSRRPGSRRRPGLFGLHDFPRGRGGRD